MPWLRSSPETRAEVSTYFHLRAMTMPVNDLPIGEKVHEHDSVIVLGVFRTIKKRDGRLPDLLSKLFHGRFAL